MRTGTVSSPSIGELPFGPAENTLDAEWNVGEEVLVSLDRDDGRWVLRSLVRRFARQPSGTEAPAFSAVNLRRHGDVAVEIRTYDTLSLLAYDCCGWCGPMARIRFDDVSDVAGLDEDTSLDSPLFRFASADEARTLHVPSGQTAYCVVTDHGNGPDGPKIFVVARAVHVELNARVES